MARSRLPSRITSVMAVVGQRERSTLSSSVSVRSVSKSKRLEASLALPCGRRGRARRRSAARSRRPCCSHARDLPELVLRRPGNARDATRDAVESTRTAVTRSRLRRSLPATRLQPLERRVERRRAARLQRDEIGRAARGNESSNCTASYTGSNVRTTGSKILAVGIERGR
jgi:hypothetical protein